MRQLLTGVVAAAMDVSPRTVLDPREGFRYWTTLTSRLIKFQGGLFLRAIVATDLPIAVKEEEPLDNLRAIV
ncbi:MAG TPA: hypothetical protein VI248_20620 [Kineosporiaceae bacterium]